MHLSVGHVSQVQRVTTEIRGIPLAPTDKTIFALDAWAAQEFTAERDLDPAVQLALSTVIDEKDEPPPPLRPVGVSADGSLGPRSVSTASESPFQLPVAIRSSEFLPAPGSIARPALSAQVAAVTAPRSREGEDLFIGDDCLACAVCNRSAEAVSLSALLMCGRCRSVAYCSPACQRAHWKAGHKTACGGPPQV